MKKFKYTKYDYNNILNPYVKNINDCINIPKDYIIKNAELKDDIILMTISYPNSSDEIIQINVTDLVSDEA